MGAEPFLGEIQMFAGDFAPRNWHFCDGATLSISQFQELYSIIGTTYGGDGQTTFALPDLRGRVALAPGTGPGLTSRREGQRGGVQEVVLELADLPTHSHQATMEIEAKLGAATDQGTQSSPAGGVLLASGYDAEKDVPINNYTEPGSTTVPLSGAHLDVTTTLSPAGGSEAHPNEMPYLALNYIIAIQGLFPPRG